ncbi:MAG: hypothetical protein LBG59_02470 [Candidatus Peribacteria bacterium]|jgi:hypothetical protein|nr:hypothetical protein [Candidatus Peribacteria bacterium]
MNTTIAKAFQTEVYQHFGTRDYLLWSRDHSDAWVKKLQDKRIFSYSKVAGDIAEIVQKYVTILQHKTKKAH